MKLFLPLQYMRHSENLFHVIIHFIIYFNLKTESSLPIDKEEERDSLVDSSDSDDMDVKRSREWKIIQKAIAAPPMKCVCENCGNAIEGDVYQGYTAMNFHATTQSPKNSWPIRTKRL